MNYTEDQINQLRLYRSENVGPVVFRQLLRKYNTPAQAIEAISNLSRYGGRKKPLKAPKQAEILKEIESMNKIKAQFIFHNDDNYPALLKSLNDAPPVFACLGHSHLLHQPQIAMVGARNASIQARKLTHGFAQTLGQKHDYIITSGLARGIDSAAHQGALESGTIAVVAGGINRIFPPENKDLYQQIAEQGCIISEAPFDIAPMARHFPRRNRIIAGLAQATLVIEAALKSGSLITARLAAEYGREVFAIPGSPLDSRSRGCNSLLRDGAALVETCDDIVSQLSQNSSFREPDVGGFGELPLFTAESSDIGSAERGIIFELLSLTPVDIDEIIRECGFATETVITVLMEFELAGNVERHPGNRVALSWDSSWDEGNPLF